MSRPMRVSPPRRRDPSWAPPRRFPRPTLHGIGWAVQLAVGLLTLWLIAHGGKL